MTVTTRSGNVFYPDNIRCGHARGRNHGRGSLPFAMQSISNLASEASSRSSSPARSSQVQRTFSNLQQIRNPFYQKDTEIGRSPAFSNTMYDPFSTDPFQTQHTETEQVPIVPNREPERGSHSRYQEQPRDDKEKEKENDTDEEQEEVEILPEHIDETKTFRRSWES